VLTRLVFKKSGWLGLATLLLSVLANALAEGAAQSSVVLTSSANPSTYGQAVILTATVSPPTATGSVTFYDGVKVLEIEPLSGGQAQLHTALLVSGVRSILAYYGGDSNNLPSKSTALSQMVNSVAGNGFTSVTTVGADGDSTHIAVGDFDGDGKADLALSNFNNNYVSVYIGNGDGTFQPAMNSSTSSSSFPYPSSVAVGDFNGDGKLDLVVANQGSDTVGVLIGNGDGTFQPPVEYPAAGTFSVAAGDLDGDGHVDFVAATKNGVSVYLGKGDGTFGAAVNYGFTPGTLALGDFNADGKADLAIIGDGLSIFLGNGDGTFPMTAVYSTSRGFFEQSFELADFNGDGKADLALTNTNGQSVTVFLGNGDGTFQSPESYGSFQSASEVFDLKPTRRSFTGVLGVLATLRETLVRVH
jgi:hypothetical protein